MELKSECFGCSACVHVCPKQCIVMGENDDGFFVPQWVRRTECIDCGMCEQICPMTEKAVIPDGEMRKAYLFVNKDEYDRNLSSSGGFFKALSDVVLGINGIVCGAAFSDNFMVEHRCVENINDIYPLLGSKYVQSNLKKTFSEVMEFLKKGRYVLFAGTACQIAGLKSFLRSIDCSKLITVDLICMGVPSQKVWRSYIEECHQEEIRYIQFRYKSKGWWEFGLRFQYAHTDYFKTFRSGDDLYLRMFSNNISLNRFCYDCKYREKRKYSDFYIGDAWNINRIRENMDDNRGITTVFVNTEKGMDFLKKIQNSHLFEIELEEALLYRDDLLQGKKIPHKRKIFFENLRMGRGFAEAVKECEAKR